MRLKIETLKRYKDYHKLYDMPETDSKIEFHNSNVNYLTGSVSGSQFTQEVKKEPESKFSKRIKIWTIVLTIIGLLITIIIYRDNIF